MSFIEENQEERFRFIDLWSRYVLEHDDRNWSRQQNRIINSCLRTADITKEEYLRLKA